MKQRVSITMLLALVLAVLAACGTPAASSPAPASSSAAGSSSPATSASASSSPSTSASPSASASASSGGVVVPSTSASASASPRTSASASARPSTSATASTDETAEAGATAGAGATEGASTGGLPTLNAGIDIGAIKVATQGPLSGAQAQFGSTARNGAQLAVEQLGEEMGLTDVTLRAEDDVADPTTGAARASDLVTDQDVMCVVGHINSGVALAALPTYQSANLIMISPANTSPRITEEFDDTAYRVVGRDDVQGVVAADFVADTLQSKTAFVVHDQTAYGEGLATVFQTRAQEKGITIAGFVGTAETAVFDSVLLQVQAANPDAVFFGGTYNVGGPFLRQLRDRGITARVMGGDGMDSSTVAELAGDAAVGLNYVTISGPASSYPNAAQFAQDYQAEFDAPAAYPAFQAYDSTRACLSAVVEAANAANGRPTREQVKEAMQELAPFEGVTGDVEFNDEGDREPAIYYVFEAVSGNPDEWANNTVAGQLEQSPPADD